MESGFAPCVYGTEPGRSERSSSILAPSVGRLGNTQEPRPSAPPSMDDSLSRVDDTQSWLNGVLGSAPPKQPPAPTTFETEPLVPKERKRRQATCGGSCAALLSTIFNVLFLVIGLAVIIISILALAKVGTFKTICSDCTNFFYYTITLGALILLISTFGLIGSRCSKVANYIYACFLIFAIIIVIGVFVLVILLDAGELMGAAEDAWKEAVKSNPHAICDLQGRLHCSGWEECCDCARNSTATPVPTVTPLLPLPDTCPVDCTDHNTYTKPCKDALKHKLRHYLPEILICVGGFLSMLVACLVCSCMIRTKYYRTVSSWD